MTPFTPRDYQLFPWQQEAVNAWARGTQGRPYRGTLEIVTGGGKTLISLACAAEAAEQDPELRLAVVVPTEALARQWTAILLRHTHLAPTDIGLLGAGGKDTLAHKRVLVSVINTAAKRLPEMARSVPSLMLIVDECHRAGAPGYSRVLTARSRYRLGLSATPDREELDEDGEPLAYDEQVVGQALGDVVYRFSLRDARMAGWLPTFTLHHHGITLGEEERRRYDAISRRVDDVAEALRDLGGDTNRARQLAGRSDELGDAARQWVRLTAERKDLLYRATERHRVTVQLMRRAVSRAEDAPPRAILFHERVDQAVELHRALVEALPALRVELEHSRLPDSRRGDAVAAFRSGDASVLVSVKSLVEGLDVPQADIGVSVASTSSVRQRVQSLGRVLRRATDAAGREKASTMHLVYVADSVDELIYGKADWTDLTGEEANQYWLWPFGEDRPTRADGPPLTALPTEEQAWEQLGRAVPAEPVPWPGVANGQEYTVSTAGVVHNAFARLISNPQDVGSLVERVRGRPGGRFRVTPENRLVLVWPGGPEQEGPLLAGRLDEPFHVAEEVTADHESPGPVKVPAPGDPYDGPSDKRKGSYRLGQRAGGILERRVPSGKELALLADTGRPDLEENARQVLSAWEQLDRPTSRFFVNDLGHAWYEEGGTRRFLADVRDGFVWPSDLAEETS